jgi:hypothetical protein
MVSPMREKRAWPPREKDADAEAVAAFEATVAVVKETVVRSGEVLVSAKEDLHDHQRWLKVQTAAVEADRERHDRWLHRQRARQEALERREQKRARRRHMRQAAMQSITGAISAAVQSITGAVSAAVLAVRSALWFLAAKTIAGLNAIDALAASGLRFVGAKLRDLGLYVAGAVWRALLFAGRTARSLALSARALVVAALSSLGGLLAAGASRISTRIHDLAPSVGNFLAVSFGGSAARAQDASRATGNFLAVAFGGIAARGHDALRSIGRWLGEGFAWLGAKASLSAHSAGEALAPALSHVAARAQTLAPALSASIAKAGQAAGHYAKEGALRAQSFLPSPKASRVDGENAVSLPQRVGGFELSQMLIIAGALLLVCGGLMLGGGLILRAGTPSPIVAASPSEPIAWLFEHKTLPIDERSVFAFVATPDGVRIKGFAIGGVNMSEQPVGSLGGIVKPDLQAHDLKLALSVETPGDHAGEAQPSEVGAAGVSADGAVPSQAPFKLVFLFPAANGGMTPHDVLAAYGGLMLKVHYEAEGKQKSFIQYLPASLLQEQLDEIVAEAKGS